LGLARTLEDTKFSTTEMTKHFSVDSSMMAWKLLYSVQRESVYGRNLVKEEAW
jgi:hypothetical protein